MHLLSNDSILSLKHIGFKVSSSAKSTMNTQRIHITHQEVLSRFRESFRIEKRVFYVRIREGLENDIRTQGLNGWSFSSSGAIKKMTENVRVFFIHELMCTDSPSRSDAEEVLAQRISELRNANLLGDFELIVRVWLQGYVRCTSAEV